jgi:nitroreductase
MDALEAIYTRKSVRKFESREVPEDAIGKILKAGMSAPSAGNAQPWQFVVIRDRGLLSEIPEICRYAEAAANAPAAILVCGDQKLEKHKDYWIQDCSAVSQNMLLAAHALGLGGVWNGVFPNEDSMEGFRILLKLPKNVMPFSLIAVGYAAEGAMKDRYNKERVHFDEW